MEDGDRPAIRNLLARRRTLVTRLQGAEAKVALLRSQITLSEVKLICFGYDVERLRRSKLPQRLFKGRGLYRRILDVSRAVDPPLSPDEIAMILAAQDGLDASKKLTRISGSTRVRGAMKRARRGLKAMKTLVTPSP